MDGRTFTQVGHVAAAGTSTVARTYELIDPQPLQALTYYRLRQVDTDGTQATSSVVTLAPTAREAAQVSVYPNPSTGTMATRLALLGLAGRPVTVRVLDLVGRPVATQQLTPATYLADVPLALPAALPAGLYVMSISDGTHTWTTRWTLER